MANGWTSERRQRQAALIKNWRPWDKSTGPKTDAGKAIASLNALKHGMRSAESQAVQKRLHELLRACQERLRRI